MLAAEWERPVRLGNVTTSLHYYGSVFVLSDDNTDDVWRSIVQDYLDRATVDTPVGAWFDLRDGGHVSLWLRPDTPLAIVTD